MFGDVHIIQYFAFLLFQSLSIAQMLRQIA